ncbi:MAG: hypothetical protein ACXV76_13370, partial [Halobacteriota archaeon]
MIIKEGACFSQPGERSLGSRLQMRAFLEVLMKLPTDFVTQFNDAQIRFKAARSNRPHASRVADHLEVLNYEPSQLGRIVCSVISSS